MKIITYKPNNIELKKYIDFFYILTHLKEDGKTAYFTFPNTSSIVSFILNAETIRKTNFIKVKSSSKKK